jgi:hypothetical protein
MAGQRLGCRRLRSTDIFPNDGHTHDSNTKPRRRNRYRSDRLVAQYLLADFAGRAQKRQHDIAVVVRWTIAHPDANTDANSDANANADANANSDANADSNSDSDANADADADSGSDANADSDALADTGANANANADTGG